MTEGQVHSARLNPAKIVDRQEVYVPNYFLDWAFEEVQRLMKGKGEFVLTARTTVDVPLQKLAEQVIENTFEREGRSARASQAALVSMDTDGAVRVIVGGRDYGDSQFNRATHGERRLAPPSNPMSTSPRSKTASSRRRSCKTLLRPAETGLLIITEAGSVEGP